MEDELERLRKKVAELEDENGMLKAVDMENSCSNSTALCRKSASRQLVRGGTWVDTDSDSDSKTPELIRATSSRQLTRRSVEEERKALQDLDEENTRLLRKVQTLEDLVEHLKSDMEPSGDVAQAESRPQPQNAEGRKLRKLSSTLAMSRWARALDMASDEAAVRRDRSEMLEQENETLKRELEQEHNKLKSDHELHRFQAIAKDSKISSLNKDLLIVQEELRTAREANEILSQKQAVSQIPFQTRVSETALETNILAKELEEMEDDDDGPRTKLLDAEEKVDALENDIEEHHKHYALLEERYQAEEAAMQEAQGQLEETEQQVKDVQSEMRALEAERKRDMERSAQLLRSEQDSSREVEQLQAQLEYAEQQHLAGLAGWQEARNRDEMLLEARNIDAELLESNLRSARHEHGQLSAELRDSQEQQEATLARALEAERLYAALQIDEELQKAALASEHEAAQELSTSLSSAREEHKELQAQLCTAADREALALEEVTAGLAAAQKSAREQQELNAQLESAEEQQERLHNDLGSVKVQNETLIEGRQDSERLQARLLGATEAMQKAQKNLQETSQQMKDKQLEIERLHAELRSSEEQQKEDAAQMAKLRATLVERDAKEEWQRREAKEQVAQLSKLRIALSDKEATEEHHLRELTAAKEEAEKLRKLRAALVEKEATGERQRLELLDAKEQLEQLKKLRATLSEKEATEIRHLRELGEAKEERAQLAKLRATLTTKDSTEERLRHELLDVKEQLEQLSKLRATLCDKEAAEERNLRELAAAKEEVEQLRKLRAALVEKDATGERQRLELLDVKEQLEERLRREATDQLAQLRELRTALSNKEMCHLRELEETKEQAAQLSKLRTALADSEATQAEMQRVQTRLKEAEQQIKNTQSEMRSEMQSVAAENLTREEDSAREVGQLQATISRARADEVSARNRFDYAHSQLRTFREQHEVEQASAAKASEELEELTLRCRSERFAFSEESLANGAMQEEAKQLKVSLATAERELGRQDAASSGAAKNQQKLAEAYAESQQQVVELRRQLEQDGSRTLQRQLRRSKELWRMSRRSEQTRGVLEESVDTLFRNAQELRVRLEKAELSNSKGVAHLDGGRSLGMKQKSLTDPGLKHKSVIDPGLASDQNLLSSLEGFLKLLDAQPDS